MADNGKYEESDLYTLDGNTIVTEGQNVRDKDGRWLLNATAALLLANGFFRVLFYRPEEGEQFVEHFEEINGTTYWLRKE